MKMIAKESCCVSHKELKQQVAKHIASNYKLGPTPELNLNLSTTIVDKAIKDCKGDMSRVHQVSARLAKLTQNLINNSISDKEETVEMFLSVVTVNKIYKS